MPRQARELSGTGIYHVMMRGINHQNIFEEQEDYYQFLTTLDVMAQSYELSYFAHRSHRFSQIWSLREYLITSHGTDAKLSAE